MRDERTGKVVGSNPDAGHVLGRLRMAGRNDPAGISETQFEAGLKYSNVVARYRSLMGIPGESPKAMNYMGGAGRTLAVDPDAEIISSAKEKYNSCFYALSLAGVETYQGNRVAKITNDVCMDRVDYRLLIEDAIALGNLRTGLNALGRILR